MACATRSIPGPNSGRETATLPIQDRLRRPKAWRPLETHSCWRWIDTGQLMSTFLLAPQAIDSGTALIMVRSLVILGFASARGEIAGFN